jgi:hypothetical protein
MVYQKRVLLKVGFVSYQGIASAMPYVSHNFTHAFSVRRLDPKIQRLKASS